MRHELDGEDPTDRALDAGYDCRAYRLDGSYSYGLSENIAEHPRVTQWAGWSWMEFLAFHYPDTYDEDEETMARSLSEKQCSERYASLVEFKAANYSTTKSRLL